MKRKIQSLFVILMMLFATQLYFDVEFPNGNLNVPCTAFIGMSKAVEKQVEHGKEAEIPNPLQCCRTICA
jgi:hypothetical protein